MEPPVTDAVIIPFPIQRPQPRALARMQGDFADARLDAALQGLHAALTEQAQAVAEWRCAMAELGIGVAALRRGLTEYEASLEQLDGGLSGLRHSARSLEAMADRGFAHTR
jgi:hypothetical protein